MKYYKYEIKERSGDYEHYQTGLMTLPDDADLEREADQLAMENRGSDKDDWDEDMEAYWYDVGVTFVPTLEEISKEVFDILRQHI